MSTETQRAEFETSMQELYPEWRFRRSSDGHYDNDETEVAFEAWKAAQASQAAEIEALRKDAARLDALEAANFNQSMWIVARGKDSFTVAMKSPYGNCLTRQTLREAIDAAMQTKEAS